MVTAPGAPLAGILCESKAQLWMAVLGKGWVSTHQCKNCRKYLQGMVWKECIQIWIGMCHMCFSTHRSFKNSSWLFQRIANAKSSSMSNTLLSCIASIWPTKWQFYMARPKYFPSQHFLAISFMFWFQTLLSVILTPHRLRKNIIFFLHMYLKVLPSLCLTLLTLDNVENSFDLMLLLSAHLSECQYQHTLVHQGF